MVVIQCGEFGCGIAPAVRQDAIDGEAVRYVECRECDHEWTEAIL